MPTHRTRPLPGSVLIAVPAITWLTLVIVVWVFAALNQDAPFGGFWSIGIALAVTATLTSLGVWALDSAKAHVSAEFATERAFLSTELATAYGMLSRRLDMFEHPTQPILRAVGTAAVTEPAAVTAELGRIDADVIDMAQRVQGRLTRTSDDH